MKNSILCKKASPQTTRIHLRHVHVFRGTIQGVQLELQSSQDLHILPKKPSRDAPFAEERWAKRSEKRSNHRKSCLVFLNVPQYMPIPKTKDRPKHSLEDAVKMVSSEL